MKKQKSIIIGKRILAERIYTNLKKQKISLDKSKIEATVSELLEEIKKALLNKENIRFPGYLSLHTVTSKPRIAMNLQTKKKMNIPAKRVPKAKFSNVLKQEVAKKK